MSRIKWDQIGERKYETGVDRGVLYVVDDDGKYGDGVGWNGLSAITESPSGAEATAVYADNQKYLNLYSAEEYGATVEAYMYPDEFEACDGSAEVAPGATIGQQDRKMFGLCYRSLIGNDVKDTNFGYKIHIIYGAKASPSEMSHNTVNESPEAGTMSWELTTTPVQVEGYKPTATFVIDSTKTKAEKLAAIEAILYGTDGVAEVTDPDTGNVITPAVEAVAPRLPLPAELIQLLKETA